MANLNKLIQKRTQITTQVQNFVSFVEEYNVSQKIELKVRLERAELLLKEFEKVQSDIELLDVQQEKVLENNAIRKAFENEYFKIIATSKYHLRDTSTPNSDSSVNNQSMFKSKGKLPTLALATFSGKYEEWGQFKDNFLSLIGNNTEINNCQKFQYLKGQLKGQAYEAIHSLEVTEENYQIAYDLLKQRFENRKLCIVNHIKAIFDIPVISKENHAQLRSLADTLVKNVRCLNSLNIPTDTWDTILIYITTGKLDSATRRAWEGIKTEGELPTYKELTKFLHERCNLLESLQLQSVNSKAGFSEGKQKSDKKTVSFISSVQAQCECCNEPHKLSDCAEFKAKGLDSRVKFVTRKRLCFNCFKKGHRSFNCKGTTCEICRRRHNVLLHATRDTGESRENREANAVAEEAASVSVSTTCHAKTIVGKQVILSTATVRVQGKNKQAEYCRVLLDNASMSSYITEKMSSKLGLNKLKSSSLVSGIGASEKRVTHSVDVIIESCHTSFKKKLRCMVLKEITGKLPVKSFEKRELNIPVHVELADENFNKSGQIDMLLGSDIFWELLRNEQIKLGQGMPMLQATQLGWVVCGSIVMPTVRNAQNYAHCALSDQIEKFWAIETIENTKLSAEESECEDVFMHTTKRAPDGRFIVDLPVKSADIQLGDSKNMAQKRFSSVEKRLSKDCKLRKEYTAFMSDYENLHHMSKVSEVIEPDTTYYLPHFPIIKTESLTTKCRIVFDGSAESTNGRSLNDILLKGPQVQSELYSILLRFRKYNIVFCSDIEKAYRQIWVNKKQRNLQRILWRASAQHALCAYTLNTVTYGLNCSPYLMTRVLKELATQSKDKFPKAGAVIERDFYVDDCISGAESLEQAIALRDDLTEILQGAKMNLRKWLSNEPRMLYSRDQNSENECKVIQLDEKSTNKTLGVLWNPSLDILQYSVKVSTNNERVTKRQVLSRISQVFDPLGLVSPVIVKAKLIMQDLWKSKLGWDEPIESDIREKWLDFEEELQVLSRVEIPRQVTETGAVEWQLHGFCDASEKAYGACIYIRTKDCRGNIIVRLLTAKSRVAPLKQQSLPKLELCGAVLLANLVDRVIREFEVSFNKVSLWCDSTITLSWIVSESTRWKTFVANRVSEIQSLTNVNDWRQVLSNNNSADVLSRGCSASELINHSLWWTGPKFLHENSEEWTSGEFEVRNNCPELKSTALLTKEIDSNDLFNRYSDINRLLRITAYCLRFRNNCKREKRGGPLTTDELNSAFQKLLHVAQQQSLSKEILDLSRGKLLKNNNKLSALMPFLDNFGLIRVGGRLQQSYLGYEQKHPAILPEHHAFTKLIAEDLHKENLHCGPQALLASLRERFWPIGGRNLVRKVVHSCIICFKAKPKGIEYVMGELPQSRIIQAPPFYNCGVDFAGPFLIRDKKGRGSKTSKVYVSVFVCFSTKATHLELVSSLTAEAFLAALKRFVARRGAPKTISSDHGTNFIGTRNELRRVSELFQKKESYNKIQNFVAQKAIVWKVIPPRAPHFGGVWESHVKLMKYHLKRVAGLAGLIFEEFYTLLTQVEAILNSRPLTPMSNNPEDLTALTPGHFLIGRAMTAVQEEDVTEVKSNRLSRFELVQRITQHFWQRWMKEYLAELQPRKKWNKNIQTNIAPGQLVVLKEDNLPTCNWPMGRITALHPGADGITRVVTVKIHGGQVKRPVTKVCVLPLSD